MFALGVPVVIAVNKVDRLKPGHIASQMQTAAALGDFHALHPVSAKTGDGIGELREELVGLLPEGPLYFPAEQRTDLSVEEQIAELVREQALALTREEVPHAISAEVEEIEDKVVRASVYRRDRVAEADPRRQGRLDGAQDRDAGAAGDRESARPEDLPRAAGQGAPALAPRRRDARAARALTAAQGYTQHMAKAPALPTGFELPLEPRLPRIGSIDTVALEERAASLARRSIKKEAKLFALELAIRMMDLTTLEGADTPGKVHALATKAVRPDPSDPSIPSCAALCVYPNLVPTAVARLRGTGVKVASVATAFPSGQSPLDVKVREVEEVVAAGADEVDMVIDRGAFLSGRYAKVYDEIVQVKKASGEAHLKVILEVAELGTYDNVRRASLLAMAAGADFVKTSTGKLSGAATLPVTLVMLEAIRDVYEETGRMVGMKPAGGIRQAKQAVQYLVQLHETLGPEWLTPDLYRIGASTLLNDVLMQIRKERTGRYQSPDYFTLD